MIVGKIHMSENEKDLLNSENTREDQEILYENDLPDKEEFSNSNEVSYVEDRSAEDEDAYVEDRSVEDEDAYIEERFVDDEDVYDEEASYSGYEDYYASEEVAEEENISDSYDNTEEQTDSQEDDLYYIDDEPTEEDLAREEHRRQRKNERRKAVIIKRCILAVIVVILALMAGRFVYVRKNGPVTVTVNNTSMIQGEELPKFTVEVSSKRSPKSVLDEKSGYNVKDLMTDLSKGKGIETDCKADGTKEGKFAIKARITDELKKQLSKKSKVKFVVKDGTLEVKNQYGEMEKDKFKLWDGKYASERFIPYHGKTYYYDKNGIKTTGWKTIDDAKYFFDKEGAMQTGWKKGEKATYFFEEDGKMKTGWYEEKDARYYFNDDGKMQVGDLLIGTKKYTFDEKGVLASEKIEIDPDKPMVALTFDDGPGERTDELLDFLDSHGSRATFFMLGKKVGKYEDVVKKMYALGNELGNHSWDHADLADLDEEGVQQEIGDTIDAVENVTGHRPSVMRPPYGSINATVRGNAGAPLIMWSIDTLDWKTRDAQMTFDTVMGSVKDGDIILIHDIHSPSVDAAEMLIPALLDKGYQLVTVSEMAEIKGIDLNNGEKYFNFR